MSELQSQILSIFKANNFQELILLFRNFPATFPQKQFPVVGFLHSGDPGSFGFRTNNTIFAIPNCENYITFTIGLLGELTLNLHAPTVYSVDWVNGGSSTLWVHKTQMTQKEADELSLYAQINQFT